MTRVIEAGSLVILAVFSILQLNCTTVPIYKLEADEKADEWYYDRQVLLKQDSLTRVKLSYEETCEDGLIFYLEAENNSEETTVLDPSEINLVTYHSIDAGQKPIILSKTYALDPEQKILSIKKSVNQANSSESARRGLSCLVSAVDFAGTLSKIGKPRSKEEIAKENKERERRRAEDQNAEYDYKEKINDLSTQQNYWENEALRKTSFIKNQKAAGYIHIPVPVYAVNLKVVVPFGSNEYEFNYKRIRIN